MRGKITGIDRNGEYITKYGGKIEKFKVTFADGRQYTFGSKGEFKHRVGDEIQYEVTNEDFKYAKIIFEPTQQVNQNTMISKPLNTHESILRQVAFKGAIELASNGKISIDEIEHFTNEYFKLINK